MLEIQNVSKTFNAGTVNEKTALNGLNLKLNEGDFVTVIGGNGAGKSTMLNAVAGVWPVDSGKIIIDGTDVTKLGEHQRAAYIGRVFQDPMTGTAATMQIEENLALAARRVVQQGAGFLDRPEFQCLGAGRSQIPLATMSATMGGNVRVGLEDSLWDGPGKLATSNAVQVQRIVSILKSMNLEVATPDETREMLQLKGKAKEKWGKLTDDDWKVAEGKRDQIAGKIQEHYGYTKEQAEKEFDDWINKN